MLVAFQVSMALLLAVSGIINLAAEALTPIGAVNAPLAMVSFYFVDLKRLIRLPAWGAFLLGLAAFLAASIEYATGGIMGPLLAGSHLIHYLGWIFMIQSKEARHYSWLMALSVLQVAVASVLTTQIWFGPAFVSYAFLGSWTLALFLVNRLVQPERLSPSLSARPVPGNQPRLLVGDTWRGVARDVDHHFINARFIGSLFGLTVLSLGLSVLFFLFIPRVWLSSYSFTADGPIPGRPLTGFTERVRLGDLGEIAESEKTVMEIRCRHQPDRRPFTAEDYTTYYGLEPRFRGAVLETYERGNWERLSSRNFGRRLDRFSSDATVAQSVILEPLNSPLLPVFGNVLAIDGDDVGRHPLSDELLRGERTRLDLKYEFTVYSDDRPGDADGIQRRLNWFANPERRQWYQSYLQELLKYPAGLDRVVELAGSRVQDAKSAEEAALRLEHWLGESGDFAYSLRLNVIDPSIDPVEDFLMNRKEGHCEYFASALALMLRTVGIPSRVITGFKGGLYSPTTRSFTVQELHAHAWVEAFLDGQWRELDPTPAGRRESLAGLEGPPSSWTSWRIWANQAWQLSARLSKEDQELLIYEPIGKSVKSAWTSIRELTQGNTTEIRRLWTLLRSPRMWFSWQGGIVSFVLLTLIAAALWLLLAIWRAMRRVHRAGRERDRNRISVDFYERFLKIARKHGFRQRPTQTAREFVEDALAKLNAGALPADAAEWPEELVDKFYQVRFGGIPLTEDEVGDIDRRLDLLERAWKSANGANA